MPRAPGSRLLSLMYVSTSSRSYATLPTVLQNRGPRPSTRHRPSVPLGRLRIFAASSGFIRVGTFRWLKGFLAALCIHTCKANKQALNDAIIIVLTFDVCTHTLTVIPPMENTIHPAKNLLARVAAFLEGLFRPCAHRNSGWPVSGVQRCFDCARVRSYAIGARPGSWHSEVL